MRCDSFRDDLSSTFDLTPPSPMIPSGHLDGLSFASGKEPQAGWIALEGDLPPSQPQSGIRSGSLTRGRTDRASSLHIRCESVGENEMIRERETVVLTHDVPMCGLRKGDVGAVVHCYADRAAFEVEFVTAEGRTVGVLTLTEADIRPMGSGEILHAREFAPA